MMGPQGMPSSGMIPQGPMPGFADVGQPNSTIYIQNLNEKIPLDYLKEQLFEICSTFGQVLEVRAHKRLALRGQAFVVFSEVEQARVALISLQGFKAWGKSMIVRFSRYKSDAISKTDGTYEIERRRRQQDQSNIPSLILTYLVERAKRPRLTRRQQLAQLMNSPAAMQGGMGMPMMMGVSQMAPSQASGMTMGPVMVGGELQIPNRVLYIHGISASLSPSIENALNALFRRFPGFNEVRLVPNRNDLAFVEYDNEAQAAMARAAADNAELAPGERIRVSFAKR